MNLLNEQVQHKSFGKGNVIECTDTYLKVRFSEGEKKFVFPDAFGVFLKLLDPEIAAAVERLKERVEKKRRKKELELEKIRARERREQERLLKRERLLKSHRLSPDSQAVFWIEKEEEERVFGEWRVFTSTRKSGPHKGRPNRLVRLHQNSACLITAREAGVPEEKRRILGLFMVKENFIGKLCEDGYIPAHSKYRLRFSPQESQKLLFWNYYLNKRYPDNITWNSGRHRYFDNIWMAQILQEVVLLKEKSLQLELAREFLDHFCHMNQLAAKDVPAPNGALFRQRDRSR